MTKTYESLPFVYEFVADKVVDEYTTRIQNEPARIKEILRELFFKALILGYSDHDE